MKELKVALIGGGGFMTGVAVRYQDLSVGDYAAALVAAGLPEELAGILADADAGIARGELHTQGADLERLIGRKPLTGAERVRQVLAQSAAAV